MTSFPSSLLSLAEDDYDAGLALIPSDVPGSWVGSVAQACRLSLEEAATLVEGLRALLSAAQEAAATMDARAELADVEPGASQAGDGL
ncbi:hypothetical protein D4740_01995 [Actinomyces sp. 2119]|uniref:Uncharacterized protein n=1 Tax=Actinomyces lilanjuaniae TaxID=2321394 RepID=A0ABM6Z0Y4_9ACTO|nr:MULTISPECIES: hypothetical protein [Actinomyces]AYD88909.1 hypothetical protein D5R93_00455 [Actinomyces lilanjuaniae]RJF43770.1 hypothetical protein D4740_01995 [Actinomyces sp. 2119]